MKQLPKLYLVSLALGLWGLEGRVQGQSAEGTVPKKPTTKSVEPTVITSQQTGVTKPAEAEEPRPSIQPGSRDLTNGQAEARYTSLNQLVLAVVELFPQGGLYSTKSVAFDGLAQATQVDAAGHLVLRYEAAQPSFCSGATYLVLLGVLDRLQQEGRLVLSPEAAAVLKVKRQPDGHGVWGRWNANGPGTARLFHETGLGRNFSSFADAVPGDFLKVWWNDSIGATERGHSVIFLGVSRGETGEEFVEFWSANLPDGYGVKKVPRKNVKRALFSRLENPRAIENVRTLNARDQYLADMLKRTSSEAEMWKMAGIVQTPGSLLRPAQAKPDKAKVEAGKTDPTPSNGGAGSKEKPNWWKFWKAPGQ